MLEQAEALTATTADPAALAQRFAAIRGASTALAAPLSPEDCTVQSMPDASPVKWHLAHTSWFFETFILERHEPGFAPFHEAFRVLYNSYYNGIGEKHPRAQRGLVTRPPLDQVLAYRADVDARIGALLTRNFAAAEADEIHTLIELGLQHEQQHQELILTDVQHLLSCNPLYPAYQKPAPSAVAAPALQWVEVPAGIVALGHTGEGFCFDNETPRHRQFVEAYALASRLVTNGDYAGFIAAGGYRDPVHWLAEGWDWLRANAITHPLYWRAGEAPGTWSQFCLRGLEPLQADAPAVHLSYFEAAAYASWAGARLPTEAEWEHAATDPALSQRLAQLFGTAWQWTSTAYSPYPGFAAAAGALGEYNGKFMVNQYVLRGSSAATPAGHSRATYRNFFPTSARWQFSGLRLAR